jgi:hypothetical protein
MKDQIRELELQGTPSKNGLQLRPGTVQLDADRLILPSDLSSLRQQFSKQHGLRLDQLLTQDLNRLILSQIERGPWLPNAHGEIGRELVLDNQPALAALRWIVNTPEFLRAIEYITGCGPISVFDGRIYRMDPGTDHYDSWHDDTADNRVVGMSLNLSCLPYSGGVFQLRQKNGPILCELPNVVHGDAIIFRISPKLSHRVTAMEGTEPKIAFAGWFRTGTKDLLSQVRELAARD